MEGGAGALGGITGSDYLVPWHLPFHRAGALGAGRGAAGSTVLGYASGSAGTSSSGGGGSSGDGRGSAPAAATGPAGSAGAAAAPAAAATGPAVKLDSAKGAVVLQRFYHLFEAGELEGLVGRLPGCRVVDSYYDRSNWCVVFERSA